MPVGMVAPGAPVPSPTKITELGGRPPGVVYMLIASSLIAIGCWLFDIEGCCGTAILADDGDMVGEGEVDDIEGGELIRRVDMFGKTAFVWLATCAAAVACAVGCGV